MTFGNAAVDAHITNRSPEYVVSWDTFDNLTGGTTPLAGTVRCGQARRKAVR